ncbi:MAG: hypothetical protein M0R76_12945 [Proteobacteria bacterium]|nr:hypothetical protein [Pseudomonadota bacterium]
MLTLWLLLLALTACRGQEPPAKEAAPPALQLAPVVPAATAPALAYEALQPGLSRTAFLAALQQQSGLSDGEISSRVPCTEAIEIPTWDMQKGEVSQRISRAKRLSSCTLLQAALDVGGGAQASSVTGWFVDDALVRVDWRFSAQHAETVAVRLAERLGEGRNVHVPVHSVLGAAKIKAALWQVNAVIWALEHHAVDVAVVLQDAQLPLVLAPSKAAERSRSDALLRTLGIPAGPIDINLDDLPLPMPDTEAASDAVHATATDT